MMSEQSAPARRPLLRPILMLYCEVELVALAIARCRRSHKWRHPHERMAEMKEGLARMKAEGKAIIID